MQNWQQVFQERLAAFGHRNWIVIADAAYPAHSLAGIETVVTNCDQIAVVRAVLHGLAGSHHVRPVVYTDRELALVTEADAPGVTEYRRELAALVEGRAVKTLPHDEIIGRLDQAGEKFRVLVLKTDLTIPYTTVFLELDCGYWTADAERRLRGY